MVHVEFKLSFLSPPPPPYLLYEKWFWVSQAQSIIFTKEGGLYRRVNSLLMAVQNTPVFKYRCNWRRQLEFLKEEWIPAQKPEFSIFMILATSVFGRMLTGQFLTEGNIFSMPSLLLSQTTKALRSCVLSHTAFALPSHWWGNSKGVIIGHKESPR